jgi:hypothetical protein
MVQHAVGPSDGESGCNLGETHFCAPAQTHSNNNSNSENDNNTSPEDRNGRLD